MSDARDQRQSRRISELKPTFITLKGHAFRVNDISNDGMGLILDAGGPQLVMGQRLDQIPIPLESGTVHIRGIVTHISVTEDATVCGIRFLFSGDQHQWIIKFKQEIRQPPEDA